MLMAERGICKHNPATKMCFQICMLTFIVRILITIIRPEQTGKAVKTNLLPSGIEQGVHCCGSSGNSIVTLSRSLAIPVHCL